LHVRFSLDREIGVAREALALVRVPQCARRAGRADYVRAVEHMASTQFLGAAALAGVIDQDAIDPADTICGDGGPLEWVTVWLQPRKREVFKLRYVEGLSLAATG
jgi:hypothetical protein